MKQVVIKETPIGPLTVTARGGAVCSVEFGERPVSDVPLSPDIDAESVLRRAVSELEAYFEGKLREFTVPVTLHGPPFHTRVWKHLTRIPFGQVETYDQIARTLGSPGGARAVGNACAANPVPVIVPCHRVLAAAGLGGYGGGLPAKVWLLRHEGAEYPAIP